MAKEKDNIVIKKIRKQINPSSDKNQNSLDSKKDKFETQYNRQIKILSILLILISFLTLLAIISYSTNDEANTQVTFSEMLRLLKGDDEVVAKAQTTSNWLGLVGAILSNFLLNSTIGFSVIVFPILVIYWSKYLLLRQRFTKKLLRFTLIIVSFALLASSLFGVLSHTSLFPEIYRELPGNFGYFSSSILIGIFGSIGSLLLLIAGLGTLFIVGFRINISSLFEKLVRYKDLVSEKIRNIRTKSIPDLNDESSVNEKSLSEDSQENEEPARIVKRNIGENENIDITKNPLKAYIKSVRTAQDNDDKNYPVKNIEIKTYREHDDNLPADDSAEQENTSVAEKVDLVKTETIADSEELIEKNSEQEEENGDNAHLDDDDELSENKKLVVTVTEPIIEEEEFAPVNPLGTAIHDKEIRYNPPKVNLLIDDEDRYTINEDELKLNARILQEKLETFKIIIENLSVTPGPVVTQYEFVPAAGIKISKIESLADDIAMALKARGIRIIAPIPGKGTVGIEIPNQSPAIVRFSSCIKSAKFVNNTHRLPIALGKTISGEVYTADLAKMPHLLIAGATGTGKSVGINTIINSLLFKMHPKHLKFVIIDPKKVELTQYSRLENHFLAASPDIESNIITDPQDAVVVLNALCAEMDLRYDILAQAGQRNIFDYNMKVKEGKIKDDEELIHKEMPYIVTIIDELADLMLTAAKDVETPIIRLAQLARAVGIHLVLATQRPSVDVITGIIKANFPARISFLVASKIDSRTILDVMGAEKLLGNGDLLFQYGGSASPLRIQNSFLSTDEVEDICNYIGNQDGYKKPYMLPSLSDSSDGRTGLAREDRDALFEDAAKMVVGLQQASVSLIQRRLKVGYARAGRIIDELEATGIVSGFDGSKARSVLIESESELEHLL